MSQKHDYIKKIFDSIMEEFEKHTIELIKNIIAKEIFAVGEILNPVSMTQ